MYDFCFRNYHTRERMRYRSLTRFKIAGVLFLGLLFFIFHVSKANYGDYLKKIPDNGIINFTVSYRSTYRDNGVGNEWHSSHYINGERIKTNNIYTISIDSPIVIKTVYTESDPVYDDTGSVTSSTYSFLNNGHFQPVITITNSTDVIGWGGNDSGKTAVCTTHYTLERVIPNGVSRYFIAFDRKYDAAGLTPILYIYTIVTISMILYCTIAYIKEKRLEARKRRQEEKNRRLAQEEAKKKWEDEQQRKREEEEKREKIRKDNIRVQIFIAEKQGFVFDAEGIPVFGKVSSDAPYGELTVYMTRSGKKYHVEKGCANANYPVHLYFCSKEYEPCRICSKKFLQTSYIPEWFQELQKSRYEPFISKSYSLSNPPAKEEKNIIVIPHSEK